MCIRDRAYGQKDPIVEYKMAGFDMFDDMISAIQEDTVRLLYHVPVSYTHLDVYKRQLWGCMPSYGIITFDKEHDVMKLDVDYIEY